MTYRVLYKNNITDSMWTPLTTVAGDGTVTTVPDPSDPGPGSTPSRRCTERVMARMRTPGEPPLESDTAGQSAPGGAVPTDNKPQHAMTLPASARKE